MFVVTPTSPRRHPRRAIVSNASTEFRQSGSWNGRGSSRCFALFWRSATHASVVTPWYSLGVSS